MLPHLKTRGESDDLDHDADHVAKIQILVWALPRHLQDRTPQLLQATSASIHRPSPRALAPLSQHFPNTIANISALGGM